MSSENPRHSYTGQEKMAILREALLEKVSISEVCQKHGITPGMFYECCASALTFQRSPNRRRSLNLHRRCCCRQTIDGRISIESEEPMGLRYFHRIRISRGLTLNLSKHGASFSAGVRGAHITVGGTGIRRTVGIPGTGIFYTSHTGRMTGVHTGQHFAGHRPAKGAGCCGCIGSLGCLIIIIFVIAIIATAA